MIIQETLVFLEHLMARPHVPSRATLATIFSFIMVILTIATAHDDVDPSPADECSKTCIAESCDSIGIRYGKYCGAGYWGCPGEKPCDDLDNCCRLHDDCVGVKGMLNVNCHDAFKNCIMRVKRSGKPGFSKECPHEIAMPTMIQGMDMAIALSKIVGSPTEL